MPSVTCPGCGKRGEMPSEAMSVYIRCPACDRRFRPDALPAPEPAPAPTAEYPRRDVTPARRSDLEPWTPPPPAPAVPDRVEPEVTRLVRLPDTPPAPPPAIRLCPFCAERIADAARKCKHCGEVLDPVLRAAEESRRASAVAHPSSPHQVVQSVVVREGPTQYGCGTLILIVFVILVVLMVIGSMQK